MSGFYASAGLVAHVRFLCFSRSSCPCPVSMLQVAHVRFLCFSRSSSPCPVSMLQQGLQLSTGQKTAFWNLMFGKHGVRTYLSTVKLEIPISGTAIQVQQQALKLDHVADSWPCKMESGWAAHCSRLDITFEAMCQHLVQNQFTSDAFQGDSDSYLFQWDMNVWNTQS